MPLQPPATWSTLPLLKYVSHSSPTNFRVRTSIEGGANGIELTKAIRAEQPRLPILILSMHDETLYAERALRAGARGYVMKREALDQFITAVRTVLDGEIFISPVMSSRLSTS